MKLSCVALLMTCLLSSSYVFAQAPVTPASSTDYPVQVSMAGQTYTLKQAQQGCALHKPDNTMQLLDMSWPCHFSADRQRKAHVVTREDMPIVIVLHITPLSDSDQECRSEYRAIRLKHGQPEFSTVNRSASCLRGLGDEKDYTAQFNW